MWDKLMELFDISEMHRGRWTGVCSWRSLGISDSRGSGRDRDRCAELRCTCGVTWAAEHSSHRRGISDCDRAELRVWGAHSKCVGVVCRLCDIFMAFEHCPEVHFECVLCISGDS